MKLTRRMLLGAAAGGLGGCLLPNREPPEIPAHAALGSIPRPIGEGLLVGAAKIDITPPPGMDIWLAGFGFQRKMKETRDPLSAQAIVLDDGERRFALITADLIGLMRPSVMRVRGMVPGLELAIASTHNHQSPDTIGFWGPAILFAVPHQSGINPRYLAGLERRLARVAVAAARSARPAALTLGHASLPEGVNKNLRPPGVAPRELLVLQAIDRGGETVATLVNFACHPETLGPRSHRLSADFPGALRTRLETALGGTAIFANGSLGGMIAPAIDDGDDREERSAAIERIGFIAAETTRTALQQARPLDRPKVAYVHQIVDLPAENSLFRLVEDKGLVEPRARGPKGLVTEVGRIDVGPLSIALLPGEPTPLVGARALARLAEAGAATRAVIGLANDELGYLLAPEEQFDNPEFSYERSMSPGRAAAPVLLDALARLPGRLPG